MNRQEKPYPIWNLSLWVAQLVLALLFLLAGGMKLLLPIEKLALQMTFVSHFPVVMVRFIGLAEIVGAVGLLAPALLRSKPFLTPLAAGGIFVVMLLATLFHLAQREWTAVPITIGLSLVALFIAWGRFRKMPLSEKKQTSVALLKHSFASNS